MQNLKPKKHLGQHFLADENIARKIVHCLNVSADTSIVEIGPGMGVLTKYLLKNHRHVEVVEYDPDAAKYLAEAYPELQGNIHQTDILKWEPAEHLSEATHFIGNLPYNVSSPIFFHLLANREWVESGVFMVQKEVADRICAPVDVSGKAKGILTILMDCFFHLKMEFKVSPKVFRPPPKVMSAVFSIRRKKDVNVSFKDLKIVVKAAFGKRRKTLRNALRHLDLDTDMIPEDWFGLRGEALSTAQFVQIARALRPSKP